MVIRSRRRTLLSLFFVTSFSTFVIVCLLTARENHNLLFNLKPPVKNEDKDRNYFKARHFDLLILRGSSKKPRKNIIVVAHGRSGSTIIGDIFNHHPSVFYLHEPLQTVERIHRRQVQRSKVNYGRLMANILTNILRCNFSKSVVDDIKFFYRESNHPRVSLAIGSPPFCPYEVTDPRWDPRLCLSMTSELLGNVCRDNYQVTVAKILVSRIAEASIRNILAACSPADIDCQIVFLIRDPRAVIPSARSVAFFADPASDTRRLNFQQFTYEICAQTEDNLVFLKKLPLSWRKRILIQRYEDFAANPLKELSRLYEFAGLPMIESVKTWLDKRTHLSDNEDVLKECRGNHPAFCTVDDSGKAINRWRSMVQFGDVEIIEHYCKHVMGLMGYKSIQHSHELMYNISVPLFSENYEAKGWFLEEL